MHPPRTHGPAPRFLLCALFLVAVVGGLALGVPNGRAAIASGLLGSGGSESGALASAEPLAVPMSSAAGTARRSG